MITSARALLRKRAQPTREEIVEALAGNYCRCTGYEPIIAAVEAIAQAGAPGKYQPKPAEAPPYVGGSPPRVDGVEKVAGTATYVHDLVLPGMLHARIKTSPCAAARIVRIETEKAAAMPGVRAVLTGADLPYKLGLYMQDKDILARDVVRYQGEPVAAVAANTLEQARAACDAIEIEYDALEPVLNARDALHADSPRVHPELGQYSWMEGVFFPQPDTNVAHHQKVRKGDVAAGFDAAAQTFEFNFTSQPVQHVPMETHTAIAEAKPGGGVEITTSAQSPFTVRHLFCHTFDLPTHKARVRVPHVGGGFGGKAGIHL